jgi:hypothetical protein
MNLVPLFAIWAVFALAVLVLLIRRKMVSSHEDDQLHVMSAANPEQVVVASKLEVIDKWGKIMTVITVVLGVIIAGLYIWTTFTGRSGLGE